MPFMLLGDSELHYEVYGCGDPVVFIHGTGASWKMWRPQIPVLSPYFRMILIDIPGHGKSKVIFPDGHYSISRIAQAVAGFITHSGLRRVHMVGVSQGAMIAQLVAIQMPERLDKLILADSYSKIPGPFWRWLMKSVAWVMGIVPPAWVKRAMMAIYYDRPYTRQVLQQSFSIDHQTLAALKTADVPDHSERLKKIQSETLIVAGDRERVGPECVGSSLIYRHIPKATMAVVHDAFDPLTVMKYSTFNQLVLPFLQGRTLPRLPDVSYYTKP